MSAVVPAPVPAPSLTVAEDGLARIAGLAPSAVLRRRLERHAALLGDLPPEPSESDPAWAALLDAVTVQETRLFRAPTQLAALAEHLPALVSRANGPPAEGRGRPLRLLSAGCATGEEAWSLAVLAAAAGVSTEVLGLDLCRPALRTAAAGLYGPGPPDPMRDVPEGARAWFEHRDGVAVPRPKGYAAVAFRRANLLALPDDLPAFDVVLCRNVLIYLLPEARRAVLRGLHARLAPGGILALGATDVPGDGTVGAAGGGDRGGFTGLRALDRVQALWIREDGAT